MKKSEALGVITAFAIAHAAVAFFLANTVIGDTPILTALTCIMVFYIGKKASPKPPEWGLVVSFVLQAFGSVAGIYLASKLFALFPLVGNIINCGVSFGITQTIGWAAYFYFSNQK